MRRARRQLKGPVAVTGAIAGAILLAACGRGPDAPEAADTTDASDAVPAASSSPSAPQASPAGRPSPAPDPVPTSGPTSGQVTEATCATAPLGVRVVSVRRESPDSIRVELSLANLAAAEAWTPGSALAAAAQAAVAALDQASVLSADGRRRMFALRGGSGERVGSPVAVPAPGRPETFWTLFPAAEGQVSVLLPGFTPLAGLTVALRPGQPEP